MLVVRAGVMRHVTYYRYITRSSSCYRYMRALKSEGGVYNEVAQTLTAVVGCESNLGTRREHTHCHSPTGMNRYQLRLRRPHGDSLVDIDHDAHVVLCRVGH